MTFHAKEKLRQQCSDHVDFKTKVATRDKVGNYIMIKGSIQEDITIVNNKHSTQDHNV